MCRERRLLLLFSVTYRWLMVPMCNCSNINYISVNTAPIKSYNGLCKSIKNAQFSCFFVTLSWISTHISLHPVVYPSFCNWSLGVKWVVPYPILIEVIALGTIRGNSHYNLPLIPHIQNIEVTKFFSGALQKQKNIVMTFFSSSDIFS